MSASREVRNQIKSVKNTRKITKAMEMVAASKMRKAQDRMRAARPYAEKIRQVVGHLANAHPEYIHPLMEKREVKAVGMIVITSDKGLCGALNANVLKALLSALKEADAQGHKSQLAMVGNKGLGFVKRYGGNLVAELNHVGDKPGIDKVIGLIKVMLDAYIKGEIDQVSLIATNFVNNMSQKAFVEQLLPIQPTELPEREGSWDYLYEPSPEPVLDMLLTRYIESVVYQALLEHIASEQSARMIAMKNASDNAKNLISELQLVYNKARQAAITQEIAEISAGAAAV